MDATESMPLAFLAHFQESRLKEMRNLVECTDTPDLEYLQVTSNNPRLTEEMDRQYRRFLDAQNRLDRAFVESYTTWTPAQVNDFVHCLELYQNQTVVSRWVNAHKAVADLSTQIMYLKSENESLQKSAMETRKVTK
jgi:hypothetical protein